MLFAKIAFCFLLLVSSISFADYEKKEIRIAKEEGSLNECQELFRDCLKDKCEDLGGTPQVKENSTKYVVKCNFNEDNVFLETYFYEEDREFATGQCAKKALLPCAATKGEFYEKLQGACSSPSFILGALLFISLFRKQH